MSVSLYRGVCSGVRPTCVFIAVLPSIQPSADTWQGLPARSANRLDCEPGGGAHTAYHAPFLPHHADCLSQGFETSVKYIPPAAPTSSIVTEITEDTPPP